MSNQRDDSWTNADGLVVGFGTRKTDLGGGKVSTSGDRSEIVVIADLAELSSAGVDNANDYAAAGSEFYRLANAAKIPQGAAINSVTITTIEAGVGGTSLSVAAVTPAGVVAAATGFVNAQVLADHNSVGESNTYTSAGVGGGGSLVDGTAGNLTNDLHVAPIVTGTYTEGKVRITVEYTGGAIV